MNLTFKKWTEFTKALADAKLSGITAADTLQNNSRLFVVLKHDVETNVKKAYQMAKIEHSFGHCGSYYVQAYLLNNEKNIELLRKMQQMGHEISYHFDVMDSNHGDLNAAMDEFEKNLSRFREAGFSLMTLCQHGNPVVQRVGYTSNRDFFRSEEVQRRYPELCDIMVNYPEKLQNNYLYFSDAGRQFHLIIDPINNDRVDSTDKNIAYEDLNGVYSAFYKKADAIISVHPHRYAASAAAYSAKTFAFRTICSCAKALLHIPVMKRLLEKYYYLAKNLKQTDEKRWVTIRM